MKKITLLCVWLFIAFTLQAQQKTVTGTIRYRNDNSPMAGVTLHAISGAAVTDTKGRFSLKSSVGETITATFIGMQPLAFKVSDSMRNYNLIMGDIANDLNAIVVTGYKSEKKVDLMGAVSVVPLKDIRNIPSSSPMLALQGQVPGLTIVTDGSPTGGNGNAPQILIRGVNTLGNTSPLYVIDGVPTTRYEVFASLNSNSIASIQVLKDASAASIYGSRASNGVIIVTTKDGRSPNGKERISVTFSSSYTAQTERPWQEKVLDADGRGRALWRAAVNDKIDPNTLSTNGIYTYDWNGDFNNPQLSAVKIAPFVGGSKLEPVGNTNWQNALYKTANIYANELNIVAGTAKSGLSIDLGYYKNSGLIAYTNYDRYNARINGHTSFLNEKVRIGENLLLSRTSQVNSTTDIGGASTPGLAIQLPPTLPLYKTDGTFGGPIGPGYSDRNNPVDQQYLNRLSPTKQLLSFGNAFAEVEPIKNLILRTSIGVDYSNILATTIHTTGKEGPTYSTSSLALQQSNDLSLTWSNTLTYNLQLGKSRINFLAGVETIKDDFQTFGAYREGFASTDPNYFQLSSGSGASTNNGTATGYRLQSQFAKIFYAYADKYLASVTVRRDGSSRFGTNNPYGVFPAFTLGWRLNNEDFLKDVKFLSNLKLRAGVGVVGNQSTGNLASYGLIQANYGTNSNPWTNTGTAYDLNGVNTGTLPSGYVQVQAQNPNLKWESTRETNLGVDFGFFNEKLTGSFDYFSRNTSNILIYPPIASAIGEGQQQYINGASKSNKGWEFAIGYQNKTSGGLGYSFSGDIGHFKDKITKLPEAVRSAYAGDVQNTILGHSQFDVFGYKTEGIFQTQAQVDAHAKQPGAGVGRLIYKDVNGDGVIDANDQTWLGTTLPAFEYGLRVAVDYKGFDITIFGSGVGGKTGFDPSKFFNSFIDTRTNYGPGVFNAWTPQNTGSKTPALSILNPNGEDRTSDFYFVKANYFKVRNAQLGYNLPLALVSKLRMQALRFYLSGQNLLAFKSKDFTSKDPERTSLDSWPVPTSFTVGLNATF